MSDFVLAWRTMWLYLLGGDGVFRLYFNGSEIWYVDYLTVSAYVLFVAAVIWICTLSVRLLRKLICGVVK